MADKSLRFLLYGEDVNLSRTLKNASKEAENAHKQMSGHFSDLGKVATIAFAAAGTAILGAGVASLKMGANFQTSMTQLVTGAGESQKNIGMVSSGILDLSTQVGVSAQQLAQGMYLIESAGYHGAEGLQVLKASAEGAAVGGASMASVSDALTTALRDYAIPASHATAVTSALVQTVADGKTHLQDLASSMGKVLPTAAALGVKLPDVTGAIAALTAQGMSARLATMHLNTTLLALAAPSSTATKALASVGLSAQQVKDTLSHQGLAAALELIEHHVGSTFPASSVAYTTAMKAIMGGTAGYTTGLGLTGTHLTAFQDNVKNISAAMDHGNKSVQGWALAQEDFNHKLDVLRTQVETAGIRIGVLLIPIVEKAAQWATNFATALEHNKAALVALGIVVGSVATVLGVAFVAAQMKAGIAAVRSFGEFVKSAKYAIQFQGLLAKEGISGMASWAAGVAESTGKAIASGAEWVAEQAAQLAEATARGAAWVAEQVTEFASAAVAGVTSAATTAAAWIAANAAVIAATGGIALAIGALVIVGYEIYKHWHEIWAEIKHLFDDAWGWIKDHSMLIIGILGGPLALALDYVWHHWKQIWDTIKGVFNDVVGWIRTNANIIIGIFTGGLSLAIDWVWHHWSQIWGNIKSDALAAWNWLNGNVLQPIVTGWNWLVAQVSKIPAELASVGAGMWDFVKDSFRAAIDWVISAWNGLHFTIPSISLFGHHIGGGTIQVPQIPMLADGGIVSSPTLALIGEAGPEAVVPLSRGGHNMGTHVTINVSGVVGSPQDVARWIATELQRLQGTGYKLGFSS